MAGDGETLVKVELADAVRAELPELTWREAIDLVDCVIDLIKESLDHGDDVLVTGFGKWIVRDKPSRPGRNPATGELIEIAARRVVTFKPSAVLRSAMNEDGS
jgi:integration host factor subunit alpha